MIRVLLVGNGAHGDSDLGPHLRARGMETLCCATGEEALAAPPCDVVLADLELSGMSGLSLVERLKARDRTLPVLVLSANGTIGDAVAAMRAGAVDFLATPVEPGSIVERVLRAAERPVAGDLDLRRRVRALERDLFREALRRAGGKKRHAARLLGIDASNWAYHAKRLDLQ